MRGGMYRVLSGILLALLCWTISAQAAITFDNSADLGNATALTLTASYTNNGTILYVGFAGDLNTGVDDCTGVTYNAVPMTFVAKNSGNNGTNRFAYLYVLLNPATGAHNVVVTCSSSHFIAAGAYSLKGAALTGQPDASNSSQSGAAATTWTSALTTVTNNDWVLTFSQGYDGAGGPPGAGAGSTRRSFDATNGVWGFFDSNGAVSPPASYSMTTTRAGASNSIIHIMAATAPALAANTGGQFVSGPLLPQATPDPTYPSESGYTVVTAANGAALTTALTGVACNTIIRLTHGSTYSTGTAFPLTTNCTCRTGGSSKWNAPGVIIQSDAFIGGSVRGTRVDPSTEYANLAHLTSTDTVLFNATNNSAGCYWLLGVDGVDTNAVAFAVVNWGDVSSLNFDHDLVIDHSYLHGIPLAEMQHCVILDGNWQSVVDSYISDCHNVAQDTQAILSTDGQGPFLIQGNFLEGAAENTMFGGAASQTGIFMSDITIKGNHYFKPLSWSQADPTSIGYHPTVKDSIEFKSGQRILVTGNVFDQTWPDGQNESEILNSNCSGSSPSVNYVQDVTEYLNIFRSAPQWFVFGGCGVATTQPDHRVWLHDNLAYNLDVCEPYGCGFVADVLIAGGNSAGDPFNAYDLWMSHNTISMSNVYAGVRLNVGAPTNFYYGVQFTNNIMGETNIPAFVGSSWAPVSGQGVAAGDVTITNFLPGANIKNNCFYGVIGGSYTFSNFSGQQNPANAAAVFANPGTDWHVSASSVCHNASSDFPAIDIGANIDAVNATTSGVVKTLGNSGTVTNVSPSTFTHLGSTSITITGTNFLAESGLGVIVGGAGPNSTISTTTCAVNTCTVVMSTPISLQINDTIAVANMVPENGNAGIQSSDATPFTVASVTDTTHFTYTNHAVGTVSSTGGTVHRFSPGNACTSVSVVSSTSITCVTPAASGAVTTGPVSIFVSQFGIPVQSAVFGNYN